MADAVHDSRVEGRRRLPRLSPRVGFAYDLFGNGKTSFKANVGRYLHPASNAGRFDAANPAARVVTLASRPWTDANGNYRVDCDLLNAAVQDLRGDRRRPVRAGRPELRPQPPDHRRSIRRCSRAGRRGPYDWQFGVSVQHEIIPRVSAEVGYYRRWWPIYDGVDVTDNIAVERGGVRPVQRDGAGRSAPAERRRLHGSSGLYNITAAAAARAAEQRPLRRQRLRRLHALLGRLRHRRSRLAWPTA